MSTADGDLVAISIAKSLYRARAHSHLILIAKKMKKKLHYILFLFVALAFAACNEDIEEPEREVEFCVKAVWENGLGDRNTRSLSENILADADAYIAISYDNYPEMINVQCTDGSDFFLTKSTEKCVIDNKFLQYIPSKYYNSKNIDGLTFTATAVFDDGYVMTSEATKDNLNHLRFTFYHTKALLRFAFNVDSRYDKIRFIRVTNINLNGNDCALVDKVLTTSNQLIAYAYVDPAVVTTSSVNKIECTYNIYDKDSATDADLTRKGVVAQNTFKLNSLKDSNGSIVSKIKAGYYYDLNVTLNPDYLYVLAEHDNKHITIN